MKLAAALRLAKQASERPIYALVTIKDTRMMYRNLRLLSALIFPAAMSAACVAMAADDATHCPGAEPVSITPQAFDKFIAEQMALLTKLAKAANINAD